MPSDLSYLTKDDPFKDFVTTKAPYSQGRPDGAPVVNNSPLPGFVTTQAPYSAGRPDATPAVSTGIDIDAINTRRNQIINGIDPDAPAIFVGPQRKAQLHAELRDLTNVAHQGALESANEAHEAYRQHKDIQAATEFTGLVKGLHGLQSTPGTPEHANEILELVHQFPHGAQTPAALKLLTAHASTHRNMAALLDTPATEYATPEALKAEHGEDAEYGQNPRTGGLYVKFANKTAKTTDGTLKDYGVTSNVVANATGVRVGTVTTDPKGEPSFKGDVNGDVVMFRHPTKKEDVKMSKAEYLRLGGHLAPESTGTDPKMELAKKALDDPNASDEHKKAARRLLGLK